MTEARREALIDMVSAVRFAFDDTGFKKFLRSK